MSDTPRTDKMCPVTIYDSMGNEYESDMVPADFARQLERELNQCSQMHHDSCEAVIRLEERHAQLVARLVELANRIADSADDYWAEDLRQIISESACNPPTTTQPTEQAHDLPR